MMGDSLWMREFHCQLICESLLEPQLPLKAANGCWQSALVLPVLSGSVSLCVTTFLRRTYISSRTSVFPSSFALNDDVLPAPRAKQASSKAAEARLRSISEICVLRVVIEEVCDFTPLYESNKMASIMFNSNTLAFDETSFLCTVCAAVLTL